MRSHRKQLTALAIVVLLTAGYLAFRLTRHQVVSEPGEKACDGEVEEFVMQDHWLSGVLERGQEYTALSDWRGCHKLMRGELVLYRVSKSHDPVVKIVAGAPGDSFKLKKAANNNSWNIEINGELLMSGDKPYHFGSANPPALKLYQDSRDGRLDQSSVLLFSRVPPGDQDSGTLGVISIEDIVGVVTGHIPP
jgi:type IV secretory pathway protease TraF